MNDINTYILKIGAVLGFIGILAVVFIIFMAGIIIGVMAAKIKMIEEECEEECEEESEAEAIHEEHKCLLYEDKTSCAAFLKRFGELCPECIYGETPHKSPKKDE